MLDDPEKPRYWFPAKTYGWGWGPPLTWEGWTVLLSWTALVIVGSVLLAPRSMPAFFGFEAVMVALLIAVCYAKGEPPGWRWGKKAPPTDSDGA